MPHIEAVLDVGEAGRIRPWLEGQRETAGGEELDLQTEVRTGGDTVWSETSKFRARRRDRNGVSRTRGAALPHMEVPPRQEVTTSTFIVAPGVGRQYARASGWSLARIVLESWMAEHRVGFGLRDSKADRGHLLGSVVRSI